MKYINCCLLGIYILCPALFADMVTTENDKLTIITQIKLAGQKIKNLQVKYTSETTKESVETEKNKSSVEWCFSGEKLFLKKQFQDAEKGRFHIGLWDGKNYKLYDTDTKSGSVRNKYQPDTPGDVPFNLRTLCYSRFYGQFSGKSLDELFGLAPLNLWDIEVTDNSKIILTLNTIDGLISEKWIMIPEKNYVVEEYEFIGRDKTKNEYKAHVITKATGLAEIKPGIWAQTQVESKTIRSGKIVNEEVFTAESLNVNDPKVEEVFKWEFPNDGESTFYDYNIKSAIIPHETEEKLAETITLASDDMKKRSNKEAVIVSPTVRNALESNETEAAVNADSVYHDLKITNKPATNNKKLWIVVVLVGIIIVISIVKRGKQRHEKK